MRADWLYSPRHRLAAGLTTGAFTSGLAALVQGLGGAAPWPALVGAFGRLTLLSALLSLAMLLAGKLWRRAPVRGDLVRRRAWTEAAVCTLVATALLPQLFAEPGARTVAALAPLASLVLLAPLRERHARWWLDQHRTIARSSAWVAPLLALVAAAAFHHLALIWPEPGTPRTAALLAALALGWCAWALWPPKHRIRLELRLARPFGALLALALLLTLATCGAPSSEGGRLPAVAAMLSPR